MRYESTSSFRAESPDPAANASSSQSTLPVRKPRFAHRKFEDLLDKMFRDQPMTEEERAGAIRDLYG